MKRIAAYFSIVLLIVLFSVAAYERFNLFVIDVDPMLSEKEPIGSDARLERENKIKIHLQGREGDELFRDMEVEIYKTLIQASRQDSLWSAPKLVGHQYSISRNPDRFFFRDVYFDDAEEFNYKNQISYRLRHRWSNRAKFMKSLSGANYKDVRPLRCEIQVKYGRKVIRPGYSQVLETRLEFRDESSPFNDFLPAPPAPWPLQEYIPYAVTGVYQGFVIKPTYDYIQYRKSLQPKVNKVKLHPKMIVYTHRNRMHFNIETPYGSGPNPLQSFIVTTDAFWTKPFIGSDLQGDIGYQNFVEENRVYRRNKTYEVEIEFERNVSQKLDQIIDQTSGEERFQHEKVREAFLADQKVIKNIVKAVLKKHKVNFSDVDESKMTAATNILRQIQ